MRGAGVAQLQGGHCGVQTILGNGGTWRCMFNRFELGFEIGGDVTIVKNLVTVFSFLG